MKKLLALIPIIAILSLLGGVAAADPGSSNAGALNICNQVAGVTGDNLNVIHTPDGSYTFGHYDAQLGVSRCTNFNINSNYNGATLGWPHTGGVEIPGGRGIIIWNHGFVLIDDNYPGFNHSSPAFWFPNNPNETYIVEYCLWISSVNCVGE